MRRIIITCITICALAAGAYFLYEYFSNGTVNGIRVDKLLKETKKSVEDATVNRESTYKRDRERLVK